MSLDQAAALSHAPAPAAALPALERRRAIDEIMEARFSLRAFEKRRTRDAAYWASPRNDMARGIYGQALREKARLIDADDAVILAESAAIRLW